MSYVARVLQPGETLLHRSKLHWLIYLPVVPFLAVLGAGVVLSSWAQKQAGPIDPAANRGLSFVENCRATFLASAAALTLNSWTRSSRPYSEKTMRLAPKELVSTTWQPTLKKEACSS